MAEVVPEKSHGLKFAEQQLLRHGWEQGKGLGRSENGISEAIKIKVKCDKGGVGHKEGEQFTFHWWDHVFNKASSNLQVESDQNGVQLKKMVEDEDDDGTISNKKPRKAALAKAKLYGCFVKSATLLSGQEQPDPKASGSDSSSSDEDNDQKLDLSSTTKISDADLIRVCGGRTAHKGARHGLTMSAKLARLEQQEAEFMAKYSKKSQPASVTPVCVTPTPPTSQSADPRAERQEETVRDSQTKKNKKKRSTGSVIELRDDDVSVTPEMDVKPKKKKKKKTCKDIEEITHLISSEEEDVIFVENSEADHSHETKRKTKKKKNRAEQNAEERPAAESRSQEETVERHTKVKRKKRKSCKTHSEPAEEEESNGTESSQSEPVQDCAAKSHKKTGAVILEEAEVTEKEAVKQKRKKCKKDKSYVDTNEEELPPKKKTKKKKSKE